MNKDDFIKACTITIEKKKNEIKALEQFVQSAKAIDDETFESISFSNNNINKVKETNKTVNKDDILNLIDWDELHQCSAFGEPYPEDKKNLLSSIGLVSECKDDFVDKLYTYGYDCIENLMFDYKHHCQTDCVDFDNITYRIGSVNYNLSDLAKLYFALKKVRGITIKNHNKYNIDYDKYKDIMANYPEFSRVLIDIAISTAMIKDNGTDKSKKRIVNTMKRAGINTVLDLLIIKDINKFAKDTRCWGNEVSKWAKVIINKYSDV